MKNTEQPEDLDSHSDLDLVYVVGGLNLEDGKQSKQPVERHDWAISAVDCARDLLKAGKLDGWALDMLTAFLDDVVTKRDGKLAAKIAAALPGRGGRPPTTTQERRLVVEAFKEALARGDSEAAAMQAAYDAWKGPGAYARDSCRKTTRGGKETTQAAAFIDENLAPLLRKAGLLSRKPPGRPRKQR